LPRRPRQQFTAWDGGTWPIDRIVRKPYFTAMPIHSQSPITMPTIARILSCLPQRVAPVLEPVGRSPQRPRRAVRSRDATNGPALPTGQWVGCLPSTSRGKATPVREPVPPAAEPIAENHRGYALGKPAGAPDCVTVQQWHPPRNRPCNPLPPARIVHGHALRKWKAKYPAHPPPTTALSTSDPK